MIILIEIFSLLNFFRNCIFKSVSTFLANETAKNYTTLFKEDEIDLYTVPKGVLFTKSHLDRLNVEISKSVGMTSYQIGQLLNEPTGSDKLNLESFLVKNINILFLILIGYLTVLLSVFLISILLKLKFRLYDLIILNGKQFVKQTSRIVFIFLGFNFFLFFTLNLLTNMIQTKSLVLDTSEFINSIDKLNTTHKKLIVTGYVDRIFKHKPENRFLYKLYERKKKKNEIVEGDDLTKKRLIELMKLTGDDYLIFLNDLRFIRLIEMFSNHMTHRIAFVKSTSFYNHLDVLFLRKKLDSKTKQMMLNR